MNPKHLFQDKKASDIFDTWIAAVARLLKYHSTDAYNDACRLNRTEVIRRITALPVRTYTIRG